MKVIDRFLAKAENVLESRHSKPRIHYMPLKSEPSVVPAILLSDVSIVEQRTNKRSVVGTFEQFMFPAFPAAYGQFFVTAWVSNLIGTLSELELTLRIEEKASAHVIFSNSNRVEFKPERTFDQSTTLATSMLVQGAVFPRAATYTVVLLLNGEKIGERDFNVRLVPPSPQQPEPES